ncbi:CHAT domain-containing protein [Microseira sp. BLCC-F43]|jgi:CHAT domain-containing protein|uniref:CHAT domain-containing protein n=1 Tax=Microseira sp. BLCC-F43 TaxID=3153602 RepID=UPI0035BAF987
MLVKRIFSQRLFTFILFSLLGLITFLGVQSLSAKATLATDRMRTQVLTTNLLVQQGKAFYEAGQFSEAAKIWQQAADAFAAAGDKLNQASALSNLSLTYQQLGLWNQAKDAIANSLSLLNTDSSPLILAQTLNIQGFLQLSLGQAENALDTLQKAAAAYKKAGDQPSIIANLINQSQAMQALGFYRRAANTLEQVETSLLASPDSIIKVTGLLNLGNTLRVVGNLDKSQQVLQQSLEIAQKLGLPGATASIQLSLGNTKRALAKKTAALNIIQTPQNETQAALELYRQAATSQSRNTRIQALINQLSLLVEIQQNSDAQTLLPTIQQELNDLPASRTSVYARINLAQSLMKQSAVNSNPQQTTDIAQILAKAVQEAKNLEDRRAESLALGTLGGLYEINQQLSSAQTVTQQALLLAQVIDGSDIAYRWQWQLGRVLKAQGQNEGAIAAYTEAVKTLKSLRSDLAAINPEVQFSFRESVEPVYRQLVGLLLQNGDKVNQNNLIQARNLIESLQLAELDNFFQEACLNAKPELIDQVDRTAAVIYPIILSDRLDVILSLPQQPLRHYSTNLTQNQIEETLEQLRQQLGRPSSSRQQIVRLAQQVYDWLIRPGETEIKNSGVKTLVFVLDGTLRNIPMAVLHDGNQHLLQQYNLAVAPGLQLLEPQSLARVQLKALMLGLSESREGFPPLPAVEKELQQIKAIVPGTVLLNQEFTGESLRQQINAAPYPVVHLATHGKFSSSADNTFILTWDGRINVKQLDAFLRVRNQVRGQAIELLVLSACETATGDRRATLGIAGVAVRAGARSTLATLWPVQDVATATMMPQFYRELATHGKSEALRRAQISLSENFKHPYYWAPFVLVGNWL